MCRLVHVSEAKEKSGQQVHYQRLPYSRQLCDKDNQRVFKQKYINELEGNSKYKGGVEIKEWVVYQLKAHPGTLKDKMHALKSPCPSIKSSLQDQSQLHCLYGEGLAEEQKSSTAGTTNHSMSCTYS